MYKKYVKIFAGAVLGYKVGLAESVEPKGDLSKEQIERILDENGKDVTFSFASEDYEEKEADYLAAVQDKDTVFYSLKEVYMAVMYDEILRGKKTISEAMIDRYEKHAVDLKNLKKAFDLNSIKPLLNTTATKEQPPQKGNLERRYTKEELNSIFNDLHDFENIEI